MIAKKIFVVLVVGVGITHWNCNAREVVSYGDGIEDVSATDRAETTVVTTDTAAIILPADTTGIKK